MRKERIVVFILLGCVLVLTAGILLAQIVPNSNCHCWEACYYCKPGVGCTIYDGPGGCFCNGNPCSLGHWLCCVHQAY